MKGIKSERDMFRSVALDAEYTIRQQKQQISCLETKVQEVTEEASFDRYINFAIYLFLFLKVWNISILTLIIKNNFKRARINELQQQVDHISRSTRFNTSHSKITRNISWDFQKETKLENLRCLNNTVAETVNVSQLFLVAYMIHRVL